MNKKFVLFIFCVLILSFSGGSVFSLESNSTLNLTNMGFEIPDGYYEGSLNNLGAINITNGSSSIFILEYDDANAMKYVNHYKNEIINNKHQKMDLLTFTIDDVIVYEADIKNNPLKIHYWFVKDNKTYDVYTWDGNKDIYNFIEKMIQS